MLRGGATPPAIGANNINTMNNLNAQPSKQMNRWLILLEENIHQIYMIVVKMIIRYDSGLIIRNTVNEDRLSITTMISFNPIHKHKRNPYHFDTCASIWILVTQISPTRLNFFVCGDE